MPGIAAGVPPNGASMGPVPPCQLLLLSVAVKPAELLRYADAPAGNPVTVLPVIVADPVGAG